MKQAIHINETVKGYLSHLCGCNFDYIDLSCIFHFDKHSKAVKNGFKANFFFFTFMRPPRYPDPDGPEVEWWGGLGWSYWEKKLALKYIRVV